MATMTPEQAAYAEAAKRFRDQKWQNGGTTVTATTENQNLAAVANQPGNASGAKATPYITQNGTTDYHITGGSYVAPTTGNGGGNPSGAVDISGAGSEISGGSGGSQPTDSGIGNAQNYINQLNDLRKQSAYASLEKSKNLALSGLNHEKSGVAPRYYDARNAVAAGAQQQARNFQEFMSARGGSSSGANAQAALSNNMALQGNIGSLNRQEGAAFDDIARRTSDVNSSYASDLASTDAGLEADKMQLLYQEYVRAESRGDTKAQQEIQNRMAEAQLTGNYNNGQTIAAKQLASDNAFRDKTFDYNVAIDSRDFDYKKAQDSWSQTFAKEQYSDEKAARLWEQTFKTKSFQQDMKDAAASRGLQWAGLNQRDKEFVADSAYREKTYTAQQTQQEIENTLNRDKLDWDKSSANPSNIPKTATTSYKDDLDFQSDAANMVKAPLAAREELRNNSDAYIKKYGMDGYNALISVVNR